ncbi:hypothetical protein BD309DRAFT_990653 [Dichomitus squalens]|uniref:WW domain-containing protein n=2 Tax=Dichomitus squalens TaxID=114155 RepID=A0A4V2K4B8_9APHY|nr:uncharacterized protein DICSQDRAFT_139873 [Dichomitus squalens LYAD-421 SS1]EJF57928.1 hypothetical protein DICSQDRAFT_139873 [Dichomitus squalens LYAD-421 SS1]TBU25624.1 hypothetical protein BD311DRAFT_669206 [Dichomitus squalens]TBU43893.1 hypothetical protein BD309DRAFT_990653 [Dichomitus squalens]TBU60452.1 hypothetical protein BD310DRAFT_815288 [Dichomitus squalens]
MQPLEKATVDDELVDSGTPKLVPTVPMSTQRYNAAVKRVIPGNMSIRPGLFSYAKELEPPYLPEGWASYIQPEGQVYFAYESQPRMVTEARMHSETVREQVLRFAVIICKTLESKDITLPDSAELYLMPSEDGDTCRYYFVDHASHALFWLDEVDIYQLDLPEVISESHLGMVLQEQYWTHIEQFPSHRFESLHLAIDELISIFIHGEGDQLTSTGSTFAYTAKQSKNYLRILQNAKEHLRYAPSICIVARLWGVISRVRWQTFFAQERARLDRNQRVLDIPDSNRGRLFAVASRMLYNIPNARAIELEKLYVDNLVYIHTWTDFVQKSQNEWKEHLPWIFGVAIINLLLLFAPGTSGLLSALSLLCCAVAAGASLMLLARFDGINVRDPVDAVRILHSALR